MNTLTAPVIVSVTITLLAIYFFWSHPAGKKKLSLGGLAHQPLVLPPVLMAKCDALPQLIDRPGINDEEDYEVDMKDLFKEEGDLEFLETEGSRLLKEAELVVTEIQEVVNHIASYPPNPEEVRSKVRNILKEYSIFKNTEYFDAINNFVVLTVERDCKITFRHEDLPALWN